MITDRNNFTLQLPYPQQSAEMLLPLSIQKHNAPLNPLSAGTGDVISWDYTVTRQQKACQLVCH
jgi:hypothetical protein